MAGVRRGVFTCVEWQVTLCDLTWQVTSRSSEVGFRKGRAISAFTFYLFGQPVEKACIVLLIYSEDIFDVNGYAYLQQRDLQDITPKFLLATKLQHCLCLTMNHSVVRT